MLFTYQQAKALFNSYVKTNNQPYLPSIYHGTQLHGEKGVYAGFIMMWGKKDLSDSKCAEVVRELKVTYPMRAVKHLTINTKVATSG